MEIDSGNTAWVLTSAALVLLMTPGLALFYGGMARSKSVLNMLMMSFSALGIVSVLWVLYGYAIAFGSTNGGLFGFTTGLLGLDDLATDTVTGGLPDLAFAGFQLMFAVITVALISGAVADRMKFGAWVVFATLWATLVYFPVAHWVFNFGVLQEDGSFADGTGGWIVQRLGAIDFAGGTAVHINAGAAALALVLVLGKRKGFGREPMRPHNLPLVMLGAGCCGSAGSASTPGRPWAPTAPRRWRSSTRRSPPPQRCWPGSPPSGCATVTPPPSGRRPVRSRGSWPSRPPAPPSSRSARSPSAWSPARSAPSP
jgi:ammonia channel protein AmtB